MDIGDVSKFEVEGYGEVVVIMCENGIRFVLDSESIRVEIKVADNTGKVSFEDCCFFEKGRDGLKPMEYDASEKISKKILKCFETNKKRIADDFLNIGIQEMIAEEKRLRGAEIEVWSAKRNIQICKNRMEMAKKLLDGEANDQY